MNDEIRNYLVSDWNILDILGKGINSLVLKAKKKNEQFNGRKVKYCTIKVVKRQVYLVNENINFEQDPNKEKDILEKLGSHNNLLEYYGNSKDIKNDISYFYFEYLDGFISIHSRLSNNNNNNNNNNEFKNEEMIRKITLQLVHVLNYLHHTVQIMHRDITPDNILIDNDCNIKLIDFGQSKEFGHLDSTLNNNNFNWSLIGKEEYLAPELKLTHSKFSIISKSSNILRDYLLNYNNKNIDNNSYNNSCNNSNSFNNYDLTSDNLEILDSLDSKPINQYSNNINEMNLFSIGSTLSLKNLRKIDIWSLGCLLLYLSGGDPKIISSNFDPIIPDYISFNGKNFIQKCLIQDPDIRYDTTLLLNHRFLEKSYLLNNNSSGSEDDQDEEINQNQMEEEEINFGIGSENVYYLKEDQVLVEGLIPNYITTIVFNESFNQDIRGEYFPYSIKHLHFNKSFNKLDFYELPEYNLLTLKYYQQFKIPLKPRQLPKSLIRLELPNYNLEIRRNTIPNQIKFLTLGCLKSLESLLNLPSSIIDLSFSCSQELFDNLKPELLPPNISFLKINNQIIELPLKLFKVQNLNIPIDNELPETKYENIIINNINELFELKNKNIGKIIFNNDFNQDISKIEFSSLIPSSVKELIFSNRFNKPINFSLPKFINKLVFGKMFNQFIDIGILPTQLLYLEFGKCFNNASKPISPKVFPSGLKTLIFGDQFNQSPSEGWLPNSIEFLMMGNQFNQPIQSQLELPSHLRVLHLGLDFDQSLLVFSKRVYDNLEELVITSENLDFKNICNIFSKQFKNLSKFIFRGIFSEPIQESLLPQSLIVLEISNYNYEITSSKIIPQSVKSLRLGDNFNFIESFACLQSLTELSFGCNEETRVLITQSAIPQFLKKLIINDQDVPLPIIFSKDQLLELSTELSNKHLALKNKKMDGSWIVSIDNFTNKKDHFFTLKFNLVDSNWRLKLYSNGKEGNGFLSVYLTNDDLCINPFYEKTISYKIQLLNQKFPNSSIEKNSAHKFTHNYYTHGFSSFISLFTLLNPYSGFLVNNTIKFKINMISTTQLIDTSDKYNLDVGQTFNYRISTVSNKLEPFASPIFNCCNRKWGLKIYPQGFSIFLENLNPTNDEQLFMFSLELVNQIDPNNSIKQWVSNNFSSKNPTYGYTKFIGISSLLDISDGFLLNDTIILSVTIIQVSNKRKGFLGI